MSWAPPPPRYALVEGIEDRAFLRGLLLRKGWERTSERLNDQRWGMERRGLRLHIVPFQRVPERTPQDIENAVLKGAPEGARVLKIQDPDDREPTARTADRTWRQVIVPDTQPPVTVQRANGCWGASWGHGIRAPAQQSLERLICGALATTHPARAEALERWIETRPDPKGKAHKAESWSWYAGWHTAWPTAHFLTAIWEVEAVARAMEEQLDSSGLLALVGDLGTT